MTSSALPVALQNKLLGYGRVGSAHLSTLNLDLYVTDPHSPFPIPRDPRRS